MKDNAKRKKAKGGQEGRSEIGTLLEKVVLEDSERLSDGEFLAALWRRIALTVEAEELKPTEGETVMGRIPERLPAAKHLATTDIEGG
jgi:hypothetical protein